MIDIHCHLFDFKCVPNGYFQRFWVKRRQVNGLALFLHNLIFWDDRDFLDNYASFLHLGNKNCEKILDVLFSYYPNGTILVPLMMDLQYGISGRMPVDYWGQLQQMIALKKKFPKQLYPFLAVDPRRPNILKIVKDNVGPKNFFQGVKVYPSMGYLPSHPVLMKVFAYCEKKKIPVTTHASSGGVASTKHCLKVQGQRYENFSLKKIDGHKFFWSSRAVFHYFCDPWQWLPVLAQYPRLKLNLAHLGGDDEIVKYCAGKNATWTDRVLHLCRKYANVYSDISFSWHNKDFLPHLLKILRSPLGEKILYGSDYYLIKMMGEFYSMYNRLRIEMPEKEFKKMAEKNNRQFLGI